MPCRFIIILMLLMPLRVKGQSVRDVVQRHWKCTITMPADFNGGVDTIIQQLYAIKVDSSGSYTGMQGATIIRYGKKYRAICKISGRLVIKEKSKKAWLTYEEGEIVSQDNLFNSTGWCNEYGRLYIYRDKDHPGEYFLEGEMGCNENSKVTKVFR